MEKLDKEKYLKRVIIVCWIALAICFGIKLFGGNLFEIMCNNENFIKVCEYADNHWWAYYCFNVIYCFYTLSFLILAMIGQWKFERWQLIVFAITIFVGVAVKSINPVVSFIYDIWQGVVMPIIFTLKNKQRIWLVFLGNALLIVFQLASMVIRNIGIDIITNNGMVVGFIYGIDVQLMILLYYFYSNLAKKGDKSNGSNVTLVPRK